MRKPLIAGNWKMHGFTSQVKELVESIKLEVSSLSGIDIVLIPSFLHLCRVHELLHGSHIMLGAQNLYLGAQGAFTGEVSGPMLLDCDCKYVLIGHSERRTIFHEDLELVTAKFHSATLAGLIPILCVGETLAQREKGHTEYVIQDQIDHVIKSVGIAAMKNAVIAYEPVWAIGTGLTATPEQAQTVHAFIRQILVKNDVAIADTIRILYGGSVKPENAASLFAMPDIDGALVGGASLDARSFLAICEAAREKAVC